MAIICIASPKGGVGKTTSALNLGAALVEMGYRVLVVDLDWLANSSTTFQVTVQAGGGIEGVLLQGQPVMSEIQATDVPNFYVLPNSPQNAGLISQSLTEHCLADALGAIPPGTFEYILLDCPGSDAELTRIALRSADEVLLPSPASVSGLRGVLLGLKLVQEVQAERQGLPVLIGLLPVAVRQGEVPALFARALEESGLPCLNPIRYSELINTQMAAKRTEKRFMVFARPDLAVAHDFRRAAAKLVNGVQYEVDQLQAELALGD